MIKEKISLNSDVETVTMIREGLKQKRGYCPCLIEQSEDTKCMCKDFKEQKTSGFCHCGLYYKEVIDISK